VPAFRILAGRVQLRHSGAAAVGDLDPDNLVSHPDRDRDRLARSTRAAMITHLLEEPVPTLADPFPFDTPLPGAYELHLPSDNVTIWYTVMPYQGEEVISIQTVRTT
jgi:hypothetical protein